ncbi:MAG: hypothetical protein WAU78_11190 [Roseiarcus sp.]
MAQSKKRSTPEKRTLILWALLVRENAAAFQNELKPEPEKIDRDALRDEGLILVTEGKRRRIWIEVTDKGWAWSADHLDADLPKGSPAGSAILQAWLTLLKAFMQARGLALADVLGPQRPLEARPPNYIALRRRIREAYLELTGERFNTRARLSGIREKLKDIDRATLDDALRRMQREQEASLYQLDNRAEITDADRAAAIYIGQEPRHILWIER